MLVDGSGDLGYHERIESAIRIQGQSPLRTCVNEGGLPGVLPVAGPRSAAGAGSLRGHGLISASGQSEGAMS